MYVTRIRIYIVTNRASSILATEVKFVKKESQVLVLGLK